MGNSGSVMGQTAAKQLTVKRIPITDQQFWNQLHELPESITDVWSFFKLDFLRKIKVQQPYNFGALIYQLVGVLLRASYGTRAVSASEHKSLLNCVRLLTRVMSVVLEPSGSGVDPFARDFMWYGKLPPTPQPKPAPPTATAAASAAQPAGAAVATAAAGANTTATTAAAPPTDAKLAAALGDSKAPPAAAPTTTAATTAPAASGAPIPGATPLTPNPNAPVANAHESVSKAAANSATQPSTAPPQPPVAAAASTVAAAGDNKESKTAAPTAASTAVTTAPTTAAVAAPATAGAPAGSSIPLTALPAKVEPFVEWKLEPLQFTGRAAYIAKLPLAQQIVRVLTSLLFIPGFTTAPYNLPAYERLENGIYVNKVWSAGVGVKSVDSAFGAWSMLQARTEILKCLLVCFAEGVFMAPDQYIPGRNPYISSLVDSVAGSELAPTLFYSLINTVCGYEPTGYVPYSQHLYTDYSEPLVDTSLQLLLILLDFRTMDQVLPHTPISNTPTAAVLPTQDMKDNRVPTAAAAAAATATAAANRNAPAPPSAATATTAAATPTTAATPAAPVATATSASGAVAPVTATPVAATGSPQRTAAQLLQDAKAANPTPPPLAGNAPASSGVQVVSPPPRPLGPSNIFRDLLFGLRDPTELRFVFDGIVRLLSNGFQANNTYLPWSMKRLDCFQELFVLVWKLLDESPHFFNWLLTNGTDDPLRLVTPILYFVYQSKGDAAKIGLMYTCVFILLRLSGEREFSVQLNRPYVHGTLPVDIPKFDGNYADLLLIVSHKLIVSSADHLDALLNVLLTVVSNISPYITKLALASSVKLLNLFELFSSPKFLYANESNHQYVFLLIDVFNNLIQYQYQGNSRLVYAITRRAKLFYSLGRATDNFPSRKAPVAAAVAHATGSAAPATTVNAVATTAKPTTTPAGAKSGSIPAAATAAAAVPPPAAGAAPVWAPTAEWAIEWKSRLPLEPLYRLLDFLLPKIDSAVQSESSVPESRLLDLIATTTLVGVLPVPHSIIVRRYIPNHYTNLWFTTYVWGVTFLRNQSQPLFDSNHIRMFIISLRAEDPSTEL